MYLLFCLDKSFQVYNYWVFMEKINILLVEDDLLQRKNLENILSQAGYLVKAASNAEDALNHAIKSEFDIFILDIILGDDLEDINGIDLAKRIKSFSASPIIFLSSCMEANTLQKSFDILPDSFLVKPCKKDQILVTIKKILFKKSNQATKVIINSNDLSDNFFIRNKDYFLKVNLSEIEKIISDKGVIHIYTLNETSKHTISLGLKQFHEQFPFEELQRVNKSCIINLNHLEKFNKNYVWVNGNPITLGEKYKKDFYDKVNILKTGWKEINN
jgi:DNA-binding response OmpR family regulator